jgi:beta-mannosidase
MVGKMSLDGTWKIKGIDGRRGGVTPYCDAVIDERTFIDARVPGEVHLDLMRHGQIGDPRVASNALAARWVEEQYWIYRRTFSAPAEAGAASCWLVFEGLDLVADVYLNGPRWARTPTPSAPAASGDGQAAGTAKISFRLPGFRPTLCRRPACRRIDPAHADEILYKRMWLRKPQYQFCGIGPAVW